MCCATTWPSGRTRCAWTSPTRTSTYTYREALTAAEHVASALYRAGAAQGDRVVLMAANSSHFVRTWWGTAVGGLVEVPINTNYEGEFLRHQLVVAPGPLGGHRRRAGRAVGRRRRARADGRAVLGHRHRRWDSRQGGRAAAGERLGGRRLGGARARRHRPAADAEAPGPRRDLLHVRHDRPVQGRRDAALAAVLLRRRSSSPHPAHRRRRLPHDHAAVPRQRAVHGRLPGDRSPAAGGDPPQVQRQPVDRPRARLRRHGHQLRRRDDGLRLEAGAARRRRGQHAAGRVSRRRRRSTIVDQFKERYGIEAFVEAFGLTETCAPIMSPYGEPRPAGAAGLQDAEWFDIRLVDPETDREVPVGAGRRARGPPGSPVDLQQRLLQHAREDRSRPGGTSGSTPATRCAATRTAGTTSSTATRTPSDGGARTSAPTRSSRPSSSTRP